MWVRENCGINFMLLIPRKSCAVADDVVRPPHPRASGDAYLSCTYSTIYTVRGSVQCFLSAFNLLRFALISYARGLYGSVQCFLSAFNLLRFALISYARGLYFFFFFFFILGRMGKSKALAHHTSTYFHTRRVSI